MRTIVTRVCARAIDQVAYKSAGLAEMTGHSYVTVRRRRRADTQSSLAHFGAR
jgi:hypothetical protein